MTQSSKTWIQTYSGRTIEFTHPIAEQFHLDDIVHGLSNLCRFSGQCSRFYSVLEHSINVYKLIRNWHPDNIQMQMDALMHDACEAYMTDLVNPLKILCPDYRGYESKLETCLSKKFKLNYPFHEEIKKADMVLLDVERAFLFRNAGNWNLPYKYSEIIGTQEIWINAESPSSQHLKQQFLTIFDDLEHKRNIGTLLASP